jgi:hypothetical protein
MAESRLLTTIDQYHMNPTLEQQQRAVVRLTHLVRRSVGDVALYYGEAEKQYRPLGTGILVHAWLRVSPRGIVVESTESGLVDPEVDKGWIWRKDRSIVRFGDRDFWLMEEHAWEDHHVTVFEVDSRPRAVASVTVSAS